MKTISKALAAAFVVAVMCLAPLSVVDSADASFKEDEAGWSLRMDNPTNEELTAFGVDKDDKVAESLIILSKWIDLGLFLPPSGSTMDSFYFAEASGMQIESDSANQIYASKIAVKGLSLTVTAKLGGKIINDITPETNEKDKAAMGAIYAYLGDVAVGDKVVITGDFSIEYTIFSEINYASIDDEYSITTDGVYSEYIVNDFDISMKLVKAGETDGKSIDFVTDIKGGAILDSELTYNADIKDIVPTTKGTKTNSISDSISGDAYFTVDGKDYDAVLEYESDDSPEEIVAEDWMVMDEYFTIDSDIKDTAAGLPDSTDNVKVGKEYSDAKSLYSDVKSDASKKKTNLVPIIIGVVVAVVVIGGIAAFVIIKKKKA